MKKYLLWLTILVISISMIVSFTLSGCKKEVAPAEEAAPAEEEVTEEAPAEEAKEKPYDGVTVNILTHETPLFNNAFEDSKGELLEKEGITLDWSHIPNREFIETKMELALKEEGGKYDLVVWTIGSESRVRGQGYFEPLEQYINNTDLTPSDWDYDDFFPGFMETFCTWPEEGGLVSLPITANSMVLFYRTDLFEEAGLEPPTTWDEYLATAKALNNPDEGVYGNIIMAKECIQLYYTFIAILSSLENVDGIPFVFDVDTYEPTMNTPEGKRAAEILMEAMQYASPDAINYDWPGGQEAMQLGKGAMFIQWNNSKGMYQDPELSVVVDKVMTALIPGESHPYAGPWYISLISESKNKEAAWTVMRYLEDKEHLLKYATDPGTMWIPARKSVGEAPEMLEVIPDFSVVLEQLSTAVKEPSIIGMSEIQMLVDRYLVGMVQGLTTVDETLEAIDKDVRQIMVDNGYLEE